MVEDLQLLVIFADAQNVTLPSQLPLSRSRTKRRKSKWHVHLYRKRPESRLRSVMSIVERRWWKLRVLRAGATLRMAPSWRIFTLKRFHPVKTVSCVAHANYHHDCSSQQGIRGLTYWRTFSCWSATEAPNSSGGGGQREDEDETEPPEDTNESTNEPASQSSNSAATTSWAMINQLLTSVLLVFIWIYSTM